ncbi:recombinase family protein [Micromonospora rubida]
MKTWIYVRQSLDRDGDGLAVTRQLDDSRQLAHLRGWRVTRELVDNDVSASGKRDRPKFQELLAAIEAGEVEAVIAWDMTRLSRNRRDTVRLLEAGEKRKITLAFVRGSDLDLSTPAGGLIADILAGVARNEIRVKSDRQQAANRQAAEQGRRVGGRRPFGYGPVISTEEHVNERTGETETREIRDFNALVPEEAAALRDAYRAVLSGVPLGRIAREWNERGLTTPQRTLAGEPSRWSAQSLRTVLLNPRNGGLRHHVTETLRTTLHPVKARLSGIVGPAKWPAIVPESTFRAVVDLLTDPARRSSPQRSGRHLLTGIAKCFCGATVHAGGGKDRKPGYRCSGDYGHVSRRAEPIDAWVTAVLIEWLSRKDAARFLEADDDVEGDQDEARAELVKLRGRLNSLAAMHAVGDVDDDQLRSGTRVLRSRIVELEGLLVRAGRVSVLEPLLGAPDVEAAVRAMDTDRLRAVIQGVMSITILPAGRGTRTFRPESVVIVPRGRATASADPGGQP